MDEDSSGTAGFSGVECCVCGTSATEFKEDNGIQNRKCPNCGTIERTRAAVSWMAENLELSESEVFSVAPSSGMTRYVNESGPKDFVRCDIRKIGDYELQADITNMPEVEGDSYDIAILIKVLEHCHDDHAAIRELSRGDGESVNSENQDAIAQAGAMAPLVTMLGVPSPQLQANVAAAMASLSRASCSLASRRLCGVARHVLGASPTAWATAGSIPAITRRRGRSK